MDGVVLINKPKGWTSFDVVNKLRRQLNEKRIGHTGTLDPQAEGVLVVLLGKATKAMPFLVSHRKEYRAKLKLNLKTDTGDIWGETIETRDVPFPTENEIQIALKSMLGKSMQLPPMVSAIRVDGKRLYEYARQNIEVKREARPIEIESIQLLSIDEEIEFSVVCSSGTYIRTLCEDIAEKLGTVGTMSALTRTKVQDYQVEDCQNLEGLTPQNVHLRSLTSVLSHLPSVEIEDPTFIFHGKPLLLDRSDDQLLILHKGEALAVYQKAEQGLYRNVRGLW